MLTPESGWHTGLMEMTRSEYGTIWVGCAGLVSVLHEGPMTPLVFEAGMTNLAVQGIHDDLGASLTRINLLSQSARRGMVDVPQTEKNLNQICTTARQLTRAMDEIVWAVDPQHDTRDSLASYLGKLIHELLNDSGIRCCLDFPGQFPAWPVTAKVRHNLFLAFREALHYILKHSQATEAHISFALEPAAVVVNITDNSCGFDPDGLTKTVLTGGLPRPRLNGLVNMCKRLQEIGGHCEIQSEGGRGTQITFIMLAKKTTP